MCFISKAFFVLTFVENTAVGIGCTLTDGFGFLGRFIMIIIVKGLFPMFFPVSVYLLHENPRITSCFFGNFFADLFFQIGAGFDVGPIHECRFGIQIACLCRFLQNPPEYVLNG